MTQVAGYNTSWVPGSKVRKECSGTGVLKRHNCNYICVDQNLDPKNVSSGQKYGTSSYGHHDYIDCLTLSPKSCEVGGMGAKTTEWTYPGYAAGPFSSNSGVKQNCYYDVNDFDTYEKVLGFYNKFIGSKTDKYAKQSKEQFKKILIHFLSNVLSTEQCSSDPLTGTPRTGSCPMISSSSPEGQQCLQWYNQILDDKDRDTIAQLICNKYPGLPECACINRSSNKIYSALKGTTNQIDDCCWWKPCANAGKFFILSNEQCSTSKKNSCPTMLCQNFVQAIEGGKINIKGNVTDYVNCKNTPPSGGGSDSGGGGDEPSPPKPFPEWEKVLFFAVPVTIFVIALLVYEFPQAKEFIRVHHVAFGLGFLIVSSISAMVFWYYNFGPGKK